MTTTDDGDIDDDIGDIDIGYGDALAELQAILAELDDDQIDIDVLAAKVDRAAQLIRTCRLRIGAAEVQVERIVADLEDLADSRGNDT